MAAVVGPALALTSWGCGTGPSGVKEWINNDPNLDGVRKKTQEYLTDQEAYERELGRIPKEVQRNLVRLDVVYQTVESDQVYSQLSESGGVGSVVAVKDGVGMSFTSSHLFQPEPQGEVQFLTRGVRIFQPHLNGGFDYRFAVEGAGFNFANKGREAKAYFHQPFKDVDLGILVFYAGPPFKGFVTRLPLDMQTAIDGRHMLSLGWPYGAEALPSGLPVEFAVMPDQTNKKLRQNGAISQYEVGLDGEAFWGSSGQPLVDESTGNVDGMVVGAKGDVIRALSFELLRKHGCDIGEAIEAAYLGWCNMKVPE